MQPFPLSKAFTLLEPGPVVLITTHNGRHANVMTISWTMVLNFSAQFAITTGAWNFSYAALTASRECVIAIPSVEMIDTVIGIGTCSGCNTDKFQRFGLTALEANYVAAPLIKECLANIECRVVDHIAPHGIIILEGLAAYIDAQRKEREMFHAVGDGTFIVDGRRINRRTMMSAKLPSDV